MSPASRSFAVRSLFSTVIWRRWRRWTLPLSRRTAGAGPDAPPAPYRKESMANLNAAVAFSLVQTLGENIALRRARVDAYRGLLRNRAGLNLIPHRPGSACLAQVVRVRSRRRGEDIAAKIIEALGAAGYEVQGSYVPIHLLPAFRPWVRKGLPKAEKVWEHLIELPCEPDVSLADVEHIAIMVQEILNS